MSSLNKRAGASEGDKAAIFVPVLDAPVDGVRDGRRDSRSRLAEAAGLAAAIGLNVVWSEAAAVRKVSPATLFGKGRVEEFSSVIQDHSIDLAIVDGALTPIQQRNLELAFGCKVIDRTALILEIFGRRAATAEGRLQVELAHLDYQQGRLVRSWTHLERQRGGFGFLGGPGETQIESDRRQIRERMARLRRSLEDVRRTRGLHRVRRQRAPWPVIALVGYTNAGKSTLFNQLTDSTVFAQNLLFATLDPTMRQIILPQVGKVIVSDTVGFVSSLPTQLIAAFRATLEEVASADLILHVRDISHPDSEAQRRDVLDVLAGLGLLSESDYPGQTFPASGIALGGKPPIIEVFNKLDQLPADERENKATAAHRAGGVAISALSGDGITSLSELIGRILRGNVTEHTIVLPLDDGMRRSWLYSHATILEETVSEAGIHLRVRISGLEKGKFDHLLAQDSADNG